MLQIELCVSEEIKNDLMQVLCTTDRIRITSVYKNKKYPVAFKKSNHNPKEKLKQIPNRASVNIGIFYPKNKQRY